METFFGLLLLVASYYVATWIVSGINSFFSLSLNAEVLGFLGPAIFFLFGLIQTAKEEWIPAWNQRMRDKRSLTDTKILKLKFSPHDQLTNKDFKPITEKLIDVHKWKKIGRIGVEYTLDFDFQTSCSFLCSPRSTTPNEELEKTYIKDIFIIGTLIKLDPSYVELEFDASLILSGFSDKADKMVWTNHLKDNLRGNQKLLDFFEKPLEVIAINEQQRNLSLRPYGTKKILNLNFYFLTLPRAIYLSNV